MNAPDRLPRTPLIIGLAGARRADRDAVAMELKKQHGFAKHAFARPLYDSVNALYGLTAMDWIVDENLDIVIERLGKTPRQLISGLADLVRSECGYDILIRRLVENATARGEWLRQDVVISDVRTSWEIEWLRKIGGRVWWIRSSGDFDEERKVEHLMLAHFVYGDSALVADGLLDRPAAVAKALTATRPAIEQ